MLVIAKKIQDINMGQLLELCEESCRTNGLRDYPDLPMEEQFFRAQGDIIQYMQNHFFQNADAFCAFWVIDGRYVSTLRIEPYRDGLILSALETAPSHRGRGYAGSLVKQVLAYLQYKAVKIYSHIERTNKASVAVHVSCGFRKISETAVYLDGSVSGRADTYLFEYE